MPGTGDRTKLPVTQAVVYETLRLGVVTPLTLPHKTLRDTSVGGFEVPKVSGRDVMVMSS